MQVPGRVARARLAALGLLLLSCEDARPPLGQWTELVDQSAWRPLAASADPLADHRPESVLCGYDLGYTREDLDVEIDTGACNYVALAQPARYRLLPGDQIRIVVWHYPLTATLPASAHVALLLDGEMLWQRDVPIPNAADLYDVTVTVPRELPAGAQLVLHLHNHGANQWRVQPLLLRAAP